MLEHRSCSTSSKEELNQDSPNSKFLPKGFG
jgi:hypothetical protein